MDNIGRCLDSLTRFDVKATEKTRLVGQLQQLVEQLVLSSTPSPTSTSISRARQTSSHDSDASDAWTTRRIATGLARFVDAERTSAESKAAKRAKDSATAEAKVFHAAAIVVLMWDKLDKAGQLDEGAGDVLFDHAVHSVISHNGTIYKPLVVYLKIIRKYLERKHYRDSLPRTQWKTLMEFSHIHLFPTADSDPTTLTALTSSDRKELAETLFYLSITHQKSMLSQSLPILQEIIGFLETKPQEIGAHPALLTLACHLLLENFVNWSNVAELAEIIDSLVLSILPIWDRIQGREAYYRPVRGSIILINRLYLFLARLTRIEGHSDVIKSSSFVISPSADTVSSMYQTALREFQSKKVAPVPPLSNPSLLLTALHSSYSQLCPYLSLDHATNCAFSDAEDINDTSVSTYTFLELFAEILCHTLFPNEGSEMPIEAESPGDIMDELDVSQEASRKRRKVRSLSQSLARSSPVTTVLEDLVPLLQSSNTNQRNLALQSLSIFVSALTLHHTNTATMKLFVTQLLQPLTSLLSSDVQNPWVYILLSILPKVESDIWPRVLELCTRKHEASPCEPSFVLNKSLGAPIPAQFTVTPSLLRSLNEFCGKPEKERRNMVASILEVPTPMIPFDLTLAAIHTLLSDAPVDPKPSKLNYTPRTDIILQEFRFECLKSSVTLLMLEKYEIMIPRTLSSSPTTTPDVSWVLNRLEKLLDIEMDSEKTTWVLCMYFKLGGQRSPMIIDALRRVCIHVKKQYISEGTLRLLVEVLDSLGTIETETDLIEDLFEDLSKLTFGGNVHVHTEINDSSAVGSVMSNGLPGSLVYYGGCNSSSSNDGRGQWLVKLLRARIARILSGEKVVEIVKEELGHGFLGFGDASINCSRDLLQKILDTVEDCLIREKSHWIWMEVLDLLQSLVQSILHVKDPKQIGFFTKTVGFFAKEMQKGQLIWQLYVKFAALLQEIIIHDPQHNFLVTSSSTDFFTTPKGVGMLPIPYLCSLGMHPLFQVRSAVAVLVKPLLQRNAEFRNQLITTLSANAADIPNDSFVLLVFAVDNAFENRELLYLCLTRCSRSALDLMWRSSCVKRTDVAEFVKCSIGMLARSLAINASNFETAVEMISCLPLDVCGMSVTDFFRLYSGYFTIKFLLQGDLDSIDAMCSCLEVNYAKLIEIGFSPIMVKLFSSMQEGVTAAGWISAQLGGNAAFAQSLVVHFNEILSEIILNFDSTTQATVYLTAELFANDPSMKQMYHNLFSVEPMSDELRDSFPNNRISIASVWEILKTTAFLFEKENITSFVGKWDVFCLMQLVNERLEGIPIVAERDRVARNGIGLLVVLASDTLDSPLLLQLLLSLVLKFLGSDIKFLSKVILGIMAGTRVVEKFQAIAVVKVIYTVGLLAGRVALHQRDAGGRSNEFKSLLRCLEALIKSLQQFHQIQTLSLIFIDATNSSFAPIFEKYGHLLETPSDFSELVEEAIEYSILGAEEAIVKFISMCLESGKPLIVLSKIISFLNGVIVSKSLGTSNNTKVLATQCLAMLSGKIPDSLDLESHLNPRETVMVLLTSCLEDLNPRVLAEATQAISQILQINGEVFWAANVKENTSCWKVFEFFQTNAVRESVSNPAKSNRHLNQDLWIQFDVCAVCENLVLSFETDEMFSALRSLFKIVPKLSEAVFPLLVHNILSIEKLAKQSNTAKSLLSQCFAKFFASLESQSFSGILSVVGTLSYLRTETVPKKPHSFDADYWLEVDYFQAAKAALKVRNRTLALLFNELWKCSSIYHKSDEDDAILLNVFQSLDPDGVDGVMSTMSLRDETILETYNHQKEFTKSMCAYNAQLMTSSLLKSFPNKSSTTHETATDGLSHSLAQMGCFVGALKVVYENPKFADLRYEALWRCGQWDMEPDQKDKDSGLNYFIFNAARAFNSSDVQHATSHLQDGFLHLASSIDLMDMTNALNIQSRLIPAIKLHELQTAASLFKSSLSFDTEKAEHVFEEWDVRLQRLLLKIKFEDLESMIASRISCLFSLLKSISSPLSAAFTTIHQYLQRTIISYSKNARKSSNLQFSTNAMTLLKALNSRLSRATDTVAGLEDLKVLYHQGNATLALRKLKESTSSTEYMTKLNPFHAAKLFGKLAQWSYLQRSENPQTILRYFDQSAELSKAAFNSKTEYPTSNLTSSFYHFAAFADKTYTQMVADESHEAMKSLVEERQVELDALNAKLKAKPDDSITKQSARRLNNQIRFDRSEIHRFSKEVEKFLLQSIENYFLCLQMGEKFDICVFRICALWFENSTIPKVNELVAKYLDLLAGSNRKFLPLIYQLCARMTMEENAFQAALKTLLIGMIKSHPYHTVYQMIALKNGTESKASKSNALNQAALDILNRLKNGDSRIRTIIQSADNLCDAYIELAFQTPPAQSRKAKVTPPIPIDRNAKLSRVVDVCLPVVTVDHSVSISCDYSSLPTIQSFQREYTLVGGINAPKVLNCIGSNGKVYKQLVKGGSDDLRQDATLSNVFNIMNVLLQKNFETRQRGLFIETYKVVPLGQRAGVIEWVDDTTPFGEYLSTAHERYNKKDLTTMDARRKMMEEHNRDESTPKTKLQVYREIEENFKPVFRHFFFESFRGPAEWFKGRTAYTRSTAVTSIVGWIVGLGDRHPQNTLINRTTGSIIQIDLGIAFDQGKLLSTPELVPFRLTRDVVDAMGSNGVEGSFRRCCEETLKVARKEANIIYTILDVFRYDPLYNWKGTQSRGGDGANSGKNIEAERALMGVRRKMSDSLSIECQINELVLSATSPENLSKMYPGWQPWM